MGERPTPRWPSPERWEALLRGVDCPLCAEVAAPASGKHGYFVAELDASVLRLAADQALPGYCVLISKRHVREPYELERDGWMSWFADMMRVGSALDRVFHQTKTNFLMLGNNVPHLHCHVQPRYHGDFAPGRAVTVGDPMRILPAEEYPPLIAAIRSALGH